MISSEPAAKLSRNEGLKEKSPLLAGTIPQTLADLSTDHFSDDDYEFLKFHGVYQQDDRDLRKAGKHYMLMVRTKLPGGVLSSAQYLVCDRLSSLYGNDTMRITTRQDFQFHGILKSNLRATIRSLNEALVTTIGACGDVVRNVMAPPTPAANPLGEKVLATARAISGQMAPRTTAYPAIWLEGVELDLNTETSASTPDPLYGRTYLPRKFKIAFAVPPLNDVDLFTNDLGFIVIASGDELVGYNVVAGGGLGMSHGNTHTFPRLADVIGFVGPGEVENIARAVVGIHRDFGDRTNRKHARLKYIIEERGVEWFREELARRAGINLAPARPYQFTAQGDRLGWGQQLDGHWFLGLFVENGRVRDTDGYRLKTALREVAEQFQPEVRLTPSQNLLLTNIRSESRAGVTALLESHGVLQRNLASRTRLASMACPALPTCGLALAESERVMPDLLTSLEALLGDFGLGGEEVVVRMTGCPNGCSRPYMAEIGLVGKAPNKYQIYLGGNEASTRLNRLFKDSVKGEDLMNELRPLMARFLGERNPGERFGDFCQRAVLQPAGGS